MHTTHWGITRSPFVAQSNPADYYASTIHEEALARLHFLIDHGRRLGYLLGASGTGKSLLLEVAARQLRRSNHHVLKLNAVGLEASEFIWRVASGLGHVLPANAPVAECWRGIADRLVANRYQRVATVFLIDDMDNCALDLQSALCRLALVDSHPEARTTLVFASQRSQVAAMVPKLNDLCELRIDLEPWDEIGRAHV